MRKLNTKLNMSMARHSQIDGITKRDYETIQIVLRCYTTEPSSDWAYHLPIVELYYNCSINETSRR